MALPGVFWGDLHHVLVTLSAWELDFWNLRQKLGLDQVLGGLLPAPRGRTEHMNTGGPADVDPTPHHPPAPPPAPTF